MNHSSPEKKSNIPLLLLLIAFVVLLFASTVFHKQMKRLVSQTLLYPVFDSMLEEEQVRSEKVRITPNAYNKMRKAIDNAEKEMISFNIGFTPYNYYTKGGTFVDRNGTVLFDLTTIMAGHEESFYNDYLTTRNQLYSYLYGYSQDNFYDYGYHSRMRVSENTDNDSYSFKDGNTIVLSGDTFREQQIYEIFKINGMRGGCIIQNLSNGQIEVMTYYDRSGTGMSYLQPYLNAGYLFEDITITPEARQFFDYQHYQTNVTEPASETETSELTARYCFMTDFDVLPEGKVMDTKDCSKISPLHMSCITQRIFTGQKYIPTFRYDTSQNPVRFDDTSLLDSMQSRYMPRNYKDYHVTADVFEGANDGYYYSTGVLHTEEGDKVFTLYSRDSLVSKLVQCMAVIYGDNTQS